jgi:hypothetical protein
MDKILAWLAVAGWLISAPALAQPNLLTNGNLDSPGIHESDLVDGWTLAESPPATNTATFANFGDHTGAGGVGLWLRAFVGTQWDDPIDAADADLYQEVPGTPGQQYTMSGWARFETNWPGGLEFLLGSWPPATPSPTRTEFALEFLDAGSAVLPGSVVVDLHDDLGQQNDGEWHQHTLMAIAPAGTVNVRVRASMVDGVNPDANPQSAFVDDFSLTTTGDTRAEFRVEKDFADGNPAGVEVTLSCNTGLPLEQSKVITEGDPVTFVVTDFDSGELDCSVIEAALAGYTASYDDGSPAGDACSFEDVTAGVELLCVITNGPLAVDVEVTKQWFDEQLGEVIPEADAFYECFGEVFEPVSGGLHFEGVEDTESFQVFPHWNGGTTCTIEERVNDSSVESDDSDCQQLSVTLGQGASCTITNTRFFEGIPALNPFGLAGLALLLLWSGWIAFRRYG